MYLLARHVHLCRTSNHCVLLDLRADRYFCIDRSSFDALTPWLQGWPDARGTDSDDIRSADADVGALADELLGRGILTTHPTEGKVAALSREDATARHELPLRHARISALRGVTFFAPFYFACRTAEARLRKPLATTIDLVARRKRAHSSAKVTSPAAKQNLAFVFAALRLFYPREYLCLFDSLALIEFMSFFKLFPEWVFGVTADPFNAHCWIQADDVLLNDTKSRVAEYGIIMRV